MPQRYYIDWVVRYQNFGDPTDSVALRLIYMYYQDRPLYEELMSLLGPGGLGLIDKIDVFQLERNTGDGARPSSSPAESSENPFIIRFFPSSQMGGAGGSFAYSELSLGTRRVVRILVSLLFDKRSLMLLEQPEDSIHSGLLRKLIDLFRTYAYDSQLIFTSLTLMCKNSWRTQPVRRN